MQLELARYQEMDEGRYQEEKKIYKNFVDQKVKEEEGSGESEEEGRENYSVAANYRLMAEDEIPAWYVEAARMLPLSPRQWRKRRPRSTGGATGCASR